MKIPKPPRGPSQAEIDRQLAPTKYQCSLGGRLQAAAKQLSGEEGKHVCEITKIAVEKYIKEKRPDWKI